MLRSVRATPITLYIELTVPSHGAGLRYTASPLSLMLSVAHPAFMSTMSLPPIPTNPTELSPLWRRARHLVDALSNFIRHGQQSYAAFEARVEANHPSKDNGWDHLVGLGLRRVLINDPPPSPLNPRDVHVQFVAGAVRFGVHILHRLLHHLQLDYGQLKDAQRGRLARPAAGW